jgi:phosphatidylserine decarboxylase
MNNVKDKIFISFQHIAPQHLLSRIVGWFADCEIESIKNFLIKHFINYFDVNMAEAAETDYTKYQSFNKFFTRALVDGVRPLAEGHNIISPADGAISQLGHIQEGRILQAKGQHYSALELLGGNKALADHFTNGIFTTIYLSPRDYHRVHAPLSGTLCDMIYVPGDLFSVNTTTACHVPRLFARNERLITVFDTEVGKVAVILVGAMIVAGIETVWTGQIAPPTKNVITLFEKNPRETHLQKGDELGRFKLGSTVVMLFQKGKVCLNDNLAASTPIQMGETLASII